jgi:hypothetical protein
MTRHKFFWVSTPFACGLVEVQYIVGASSNDEEAFYVCNTAPIYRKLVEGLSLKEAKKKLYNSQWVEINP